LTLQEELKSKLYYSKTTGYFLNHKNQVLGTIKDQGYVITFLEVTDKIDMSDTGWEL